MSFCPATSTCITVSPLFDVRLWAVATCVVYMSSGSSHAAVTFKVAPQTFIMLTCFGLLLTAVDLWTEMLEKPTSVHVEKAVEAYLKS